MKKTLAGMLGAAAVAALIGVAMAQQAPRTVRIATEGAYPPWNATDSAGQLVGFELDLGRDLCRRANLQCTFSAQAFDGMIPALNQGRFDAIMAGMANTERRREQIAFSAPYAGTPARFAVMRTSPLANWTGSAIERIHLGTMTPEKQAIIDALRAHFRNRTIGVQTSTIHANFLQQYMSGAVQVRTYDTQENLELDLQAGRVDAALASMSVWVPMIARGTAYAMVGPGLQGGVFGQGVGVGLRRDDADLIARFNAAVTAARADGTIERLSQQWFGFSVVVPE